MPLKNYPFLHRRFGPKLAYFILYSIYTFIIYKKGKGRTIKIALKGLLKKSRKTKPNKYYKI